MIKFQIELHDHHFALLQQMADEQYRDPKQQAAWLIGCAVSASAVAQEDDGEKCCSVPIDRLFPGGQS